MKRFKQIAVLVSSALLLTPLFAVNTAQAATTEEFPLEVSRTTSATATATKSDTDNDTATTNNTQSYQNVSTSDITQNEHFDTNTIPYYLTPGLAVGVQKDIRAAALNWNMNTKVNLYETKAKDTALIVFTNNGTSSKQNGLTTNTVNKSKGYTEVVSSKIDLSKNSIPQSTVSTMGTRVAEHEIGHALGLKDTYSDANSSVMWYKTPKTDITAKDIAAINQYYK